MTPGAEGDGLQHKADKAYWEQVWSDSVIPSRADPSIGGIRNLFTRRLDELYRHIFVDSTEGRLFLEVGCGASIWLPYFAKQFGFRVSGIDYSPKGSRLAEEILKKAGVEGQVRRSDFFDPPRDMLEHFDVVYSAGVAEHFVPTEKCIAAFARFLTPGGLMVTTVPNLAGATGWLQRKFNRKIFDLHVPLTREDLRVAQEAAGLEVERCEYVLSSGCVVSTDGLPPGPRTTAKEQLVLALRRLAAISWWIEDKTVRLPNTRLLSPFIVCVARRA